MRAAISALPVTNRATPWARVAPLLIIVAGVVHLVVTPTHWAHAPAHGLFFAVVGVLEILWGIAFWRRPSPWLYAVGWVIAGSLVTLWIVTRFAVAPFHGVAEPVDLGGVVCKLAEALGLISLGALAVTGVTAAEEKRRVWRTMALLLAFSAVLGLATYGVARAAEPLLPALAASHGADDHQHEADDTHGETQEAGQTQQEQPQTDHTHEHGSDGHTH